MDDDTEGDISSINDPKGSLIPNGPYPLITKGTLNYFDSSPHGRLSHFVPKKAAVIEKQQHSRKQRLHFSLFVIQARME